MQAGDERRSGLLCLRCSQPSILLRVLVYIALSKNNAQYSIQQAGVTQSLPDTSLTGHSHRHEEEQTINTGATSPETLKPLSERERPTQSLDPRPRYCRPSHRENSNIEGDRQAETRFYSQLALPWRGRHHHKTNCTVGILRQEHMKSSPTAPSSPTTPDRTFHHSHVKVSATRQACGSSRFPNQEGAIFCSRRLNRQVPIVKNVLERGCCGL